MGFLISLASGWAWPRWAATLFGWAVPVIAVAALLGSIYAIIYHRGSTAGAAKVEARQEKAHAKTVAEARSDERQAQATVDMIGKRVAIADDKTTTLVRSKITEIHDALDATPGAAAGSAAPAVFDTGGVRASLNAVVDSANRAADAADAER
jgi:2',3'-cyclic-nucleotide 2'-phosphodiesterase (5'-nucleotidase family)